MQPSCLVYGTISRFDMNSVSQWNETASAGEFSASQVSVYTPAVISRSLREGWGGGGVLSDRPRRVFAL